MREKLNEEIVLSLQDLATRHGICGEVDDAFPNLDIIA